MASPVAFTHGEARLCDVAAYLLIEPKALTKGVAFGAIFIRLTPKRGGGPTTPRVNKRREQGVMSGTITEKKVVTHPYLSMICAISILFVLPRYGSIAVMLGCARFLSAYVAVSPESFRSRSGSMMPATCLVAAVWAAAAVITALALMGEIQS
jgi:hypothetical protein